MKPDIKLKSLDWPNHARRGMAMLSLPTLPLLKIAGHFEVLSGRTRLERALESPHVDKSYEILPCDWLYDTTRWSMQSCPLEFRPKMCSRKNLIDSVSTSDSRSTQPKRCWDVVKAGRAEFWQLHGEYKWRKGRMSELCWKEHWNFVKPGIWKIYIRRKQISEDIWSSTVWPLLFSGGKLNFVDSSWENSAAFP